MENLRWIILALGLTIVLLIYLFGRNKDKTRQTNLPEIVAADEMPSLSTTEDMPDEQSVKIYDDFVPSEINHFELDQALVEKVSASVDDVLPDVMTDGSVLKSKVKIESETKETESQDTDVAELEVVESEDVTDTNPEEYADDLIIMHVLAKSAYFSGSDLLKVINHQQLKFGDMNIYHAYDDSNDITFSMSNMVEPGHFEPENISDMRTPGVILFMQLSLVQEPKVALERMINCASALAADLDAKVMSAKQRLLTEKNIENFREKAAYFS